MTQSTCSVEGCEVSPVARTLCRKHYMRWRRHGDATVGPRTAASRFWDRVQKGEGCWEWGGAPLEGGYGVISVNGKCQLVHRFSYELNVGPIPVGMHIDHVCHNRLCVNPAHLRLATSKQNNENLQGARSTNKSSGVRGVYRNGDNWIARIGHNGEVLNLGTYATVEEAAIVAAAARRRLFTHSQN